MAIRKELETVLYQQKHIHKIWMGKAIKRGVTPSDESLELVWELLVAYGEITGSFDEAKEDIYKTAYELATLALADITIESIFDIYRDCLVDSMINKTGGIIYGQCKTLVQFSNILSSAFCEAHTDQLRRAIRHNRTEIFSNELRLAKNIQRHLLPKEIPQVPGFDFAGRLIPAEEVGGDYWSIKHYVEDDVITMKLADISGHGVAAATLVAAVKFISGSYYRSAKSASEVMWQTNRVLTKETPYDVLVTMVYGWLHPSTHELTIVNAGHSPVFLCQKDRCTDIGPTGPVLGVSENVEYQEKSYILSKDDVLFFGSDGITEAGITEQFGTERLKKLVMSNAHLSAHQIADKVVEAVIDYAKHPHDDISLLVTKITDDPPESS